MIIYLIITSILFIPDIVQASAGVAIIENPLDLVQWLINALFTIVGIFGGWILSSIQKSLKELQSADSILADKVHSIDVLVAGQYVKKDELEKLSIALFSKLDRIELKLDNKADKL